MVRLLTFLLLVNLWGLQNAYSAAIRVNLTTPKGNKHAFLFDGTEAFHEPPWWDYAGKKRVGHCSRLLTIAGGISVAPAGPAEDIELEMTAAHLTPQLKTSQALAVYVFSMAASPAAHQSLLIVWMGTHGLSHAVVPLSHGAKVRKVAIYGPSTAKTVPMKSYYETVTASVVYLGFDDDSASSHLALAFSHVSSLPAGFASQLQVDNGITTIVDPVAFEIPDGVLSWDEPMLGLPLVAWHEVGKEPGEYGEPLFGGVMVALPAAQRLLRVSPTMKSVEVLDASSNELIPPGDFNYFMTYGGEQLQRQRHEHPPELEKQPGNCCGTGCQTCGYGRFLIRTNRCNKPF